MQRHFPNLRNISRRLILGNVLKVYFSKHFIFNILTNYIKNIQRIPHFADGMMSFLIVEKIKDLGGGKDF